MVHATVDGGPELVFGLVGPIGTDMECVVDELSSSLREVGYDPHLVHITALLPKIVGAQADISSLSEKINLGNFLREKTGERSILSAIAIMRIRELREQIHIKANTKLDSAKLELADIPAPKAAYIIRQLKRDEEISLLRKVYGNSFIQVSVAIDEAKQFDDVVRIVTRQEPQLTADQRNVKARELIKTDKQELSNDHGQRMADAYQSADFFVSGSNREEVTRCIGRFIRAVFGYNHIGPTKDEFGAMLAKTASLRSVDLSRQVGAALTNVRGDLISLGCNEVPSPLGGQYWSDDDCRARDVDLGLDSNKVETSGIIEGYLTVLQESGMLVEDFRKLMTTENYTKKLKNSAISDITEFGRITHAEMSAITEAARLGRSLAGATMYVTTFPCHNCAKHIVASGISRLVYIEPYPKSRALSLHRDSLTAMPNEKGKVVVEHFEGIAPRRFRKIFEKGGRKNKINHTVNTWYEGRPMPLLWERASIHTKEEFDELKRIAPKMLKLPSNNTAIETP